MMSKIRLKYLGEGTCIPGALYKSGAVCYPTTASIINPLGQAATHYIYAPSIGKREGGN